MKILHLEDDIDFFEIVADYCKQPHRTIVHAPTVDEAILLSQKIDFDLVISDYYLKAETSERFLNYLSTSQLNLPVLILSSADGKALESQLRYENLLAIIPKLEASRLNSLIEKMDFIWF